MLTPGFWRVGLDAALRLLGRIACDVSVKSYFFTVKANSFNKLPPYTRLTVDSSQLTFLRSSKSRDTKTIA